MTYTYTYKMEEKQNPYTGFTSFQHFNGEKLYSDIVVKPENKYTETERVECYPTSPDAAENGRNEGWYPDSTVAYIRVLWKEFEPERGVYNYGFIEDILKNARSHGQSLVFRLMAHSTRACDDVPDWLRELIPCPERPPMKRLKDSPTDPLFLELFLEAVLKLGARFDSDPTLDAVDISLPGAWGEGHKLELYPEDTLTRIVDTYIKAFPTTQLYAQAARPNLIRYAGRFTKVGWRGDGFGSPKHIYEMYPAWVEEIKDVWKTAPVSFEAYWWINEWTRQGWNIDDIIELSLKWHLSTFNAKSIAFDPALKPKIEAWISKMGYHFTPVSMTVPDSVPAGGDLELSLTVNNCGVAPIYKKLPLYICLKGKDGVYEKRTEVDITKWMPGESREELSLPIPATLTYGSYDIFISIPHGEGGYIAFAADLEREGCYYRLGEIRVTKAENLL